MFGLDQKRVALDLLLGVVGVPFGLTIAWYTTQLPPTPPPPLSLSLSPSLPLSSSLPLSLFVVTKHGY